MTDVATAKCPCGSSLSFEKCCNPYLSGQAVPETAEQLMRSRYTAYTVGNIDYIRTTLAPESQHDFDAANTKKWAKQSKWLGLKIHTASGGVSDKKGTVEFTATYKEKTETLEHHEVSKFRKDETGRWLFLSGDAHTHKEGEGHNHHHAKPETVVRDSPKIGRNDSCPCGSQKKYKKCCGA